MRDGMENEKPSVLMVHNYYRIPGGEDTVVANERKLLEENGHRVVFYHKSNSEIEGFRLLKKLAFPFMTIFNGKTYREVKAIIKRERIDIVHVHNTLSLISPSVYYAARKCRIPVVQTIHNFRMLCPGAAFYREGKICTDCVEKGLVCAVWHACYRGSRAQTLACVIGAACHRMTGIYGKLNYICLTGFNKEMLLQHRQIKCDRVFVKPNFVSLAQRPVPWDKRREQFVFAGRLDSLKGIEIVLGAWKMMGEAAPLLVICGIGPREEWCRRYIAENKLKNIEMRGGVPNGEVLRLLGESRGMILASQWYEGFPMSLAEAYSVGTPVIGSDIGNVGDIIKKYGMGIVFKHDSSRDLAEKVMQQDLFRGYEGNVRNAVSDARLNYELLMEIYDKAGEFV